MYGAPAGTPLWQLEYEDWPLRNTIVVRLYAASMQDAIDRLPEGALFVAGRRLHPSEKGNSCGSPALF